MATRKPRCGEIIPGSAEVSIPNSHDPAQGSRPMALFLSQRAVQMPRYVGKDSYVQQPRDFGHQPRCESWRRMWEAGLAKSGKLAHPVAVWALDVVGL